jgi:arsenite methyltransferase
MSSDPIAREDEMAVAEQLPQADASSLVDRELLEAQVQDMESAGFQVGEVRTTDYDFISERALDACSTYGVESISLAAAKTA